MSNDVLQLSHIRFVKRIAVGSDDPRRIKSQAENEEAMALVNQCLNGIPRGYILSIEKSFNIYNHGENQVLLQYAVYNIGFNRKPGFLD
jgi:hypothetical protein